MRQKQLIPNNWDIRADKSTDEENRKNENDAIGIKKKT